MEKVSPIELNGFSKDVIIYDIVYKPTDTKLIKDGLKKGYKTFRGMSMLLNQAILSQEIWLNKKIDLKIIKKIEGVLLTYIE
jgi:shikimate dehydrogenase